MNRVALNKLIQKPITGEWGEDGNDVNIIRTTNFRNNGELDLTNVVRRAVSKSKVNTKRLLPGDIIIEKSGGSPTQPVGRVVFYEGSDGEYLCNNFTSVLRPSKELVFPKYLHYQLFSAHKFGVTEMFQNKTTGIINLQLSRYVSKLQIPIPPLKTQKRIAQILDDAQALKQKTELLLKEYDALAQSIFLDMFGDPVVNPKKWILSNLKAGCEIFRDGPFGSNLKTEHYADSGIRVVRLKNIGVGEFVDNDKVFIKEGHAASLIKNKCVAGDIIIATMGEPNLRACILPNYIDAAINKADCLICRPKKDVFNSVYLLSLLNNESLVNSLANLILGQTRARISMGRLSTRAVITPPIDIQNQFAEKIALIEQQKELAKQELKESEDLFNCLLQKAFKGELV